MIRIYVLFSLLSFSLNAALCPATLSKVARTVTTWRVPTDIKNFNKADYEKGVAFYASKRGKLLNESDRPETIEQKMAFLDAFRPSGMRLSLDQMSRAQKKQLSQILKGIDFKAGMSKDKLSQFFIDTYLLSHPSAETLINRWKMGDDAFFKKLGEKRFVEEFSKQGLFEATKKFGILLPESRKEKIFNYISSYFSKETKIPGALVNKILREGFTEKNYAAFEKHFGKSQRTRAIWNHFRSSLSLGLFGFFCYQDLRDQDDKDKLQAEAITGQINETADEAMAVAKEIMASIPDDVNIKEHLLAEWLKDYIDVHGLPPEEGSSDFKEYEELKNMLSKETKP